MRWLYQARAEPVSQDAEALHPDAWARAAEVPVRQRARSSSDVLLLVQPIAAQAEVFADAWARIPEIPVLRPRPVTHFLPWSGITEASLLVTPSSDGWARMPEVPVLPARRVHPGLAAEVIPVSTEAGAAFHDAWARLPEIPVRLPIRVTPHLPWGGVSEQSLLATPGMDTWYRATEIPTIPLPHLQLTAMSGDLESMVSSAPPADTDFPSAYRPSRADLSESENDRRPRANVE